MNDARKNSLFVLDDGETYAGEGLELHVTDAELERILEGEKIYEVVPDWNDPRRDLPSGVPNLPALKQDSVFEYTFNNEHVDNRVWIRVKDPNGDTEADIGILINHEGLSIDAYPFSKEDDPVIDGPVLQNYAFWSDFNELVDLRRKLKGGGQDDN